MIKQHFWKIFTVTAIVLVGAAFLYSVQIGKQANEGIELKSHVKGNPEAEVVLRKHSDFQCPACAEFSVVVREIMDAYGDQIRFEYKHFPLIAIHPQAVPAARAAEAAGQQGKFFEMHDKLFDNLSAWSRSPNPQGNFVAYAEEIGLDIETFRRHMRSSILRDKVMEEYDEARELGLTGTPTFFLNGERMQYVTYQDFRDEIERAIFGEVQTEEMANTDSMVDENNESDPEAE